MQVQELKDKTNNLMDFEMNRKMNTQILDAH
jgi:hypothetical protein